MSSLREFVETLWGDDAVGCGDSPLTGTTIGGRFEEPWKSWQATVERLRQHIVRLEQRTSRELSRFLDAVRDDDGHYRAETELDSEDPGGQRIRHVEQLLAELRERQESQTACW